MLEVNGRNAKELSQARNADLTLVWVNAVGHTSRFALQETGSANLSYKANTHSRVSAEESDYSFSPLSFPSPVFFDLLNTTIDAAVTITKADKMIITWCIGNVSS